MVKATSLGAQLCSCLLHQFTTLLLSIVLHFYRFNTNSN